MVGLLYDFGGKVSGNLLPILQAIFDLGPVIRNTDDFTEIL